MEEESRDKMKTVLSPPSIQRVDGEAGLRRVVSCPSSAVSTSFFLFRHKTAYGLLLFLVSAPATSTPSNKV